MLQSDSTVGGENVIVEIDEAKVGKRKYNRGKRVEGQWVFGGCEYGNSNNMFLVPVKDRSARTLEAEIEKWIMPHTTIY